MSQYQISQLRACLLIVRRVVRRGLAFFAPLLHHGCIIDMYIHPNFLFVIAKLDDVGSLCVHAVTCNLNEIRGSSFCYLNMWTSGRHGFLLPLGLPSEPSVRNANTISIRTAALVAISLCLDHEILVEQPDHPRGLISLPRWQTIAAHTTLYRSRCKQGAYQAQTPKTNCAV